MSCTLGRPLLGLGLCHPVMSLALPTSEIGKQRGPGDLTLPCGLSPAKPLGPRRGELTCHRGLLLRSVPSVLVFLLLLRQLPELREVRLQQLGNRLVGQAGGDGWRCAPGDGGLE